MNKSTVTIVINGNTYRLCASDGAAIRNMQAADREHLLELLEEVKRQDSLSQVAIEKAMSRTGSSPVSTASVAPGEGVTAYRGNASADLGKGDVDALMARLVFEEKNNRKPGLTRQTLYKVVGGFLLVVFVLVLLS
jgi:hypothetical protein